MTPVNPREDRTTFGLLVMLMAVSFFTCIDTSAKWLISVAALPALQVVFARYAGHFVLAVAVYAPMEGADAFRSNAPLKQFLRSSFLLGSTVLNFLALQHLPITLTTTIMFAGPIVVTFLAIPLLGEKVGLRRIIAVCVGFIGVLVVIRPWGADFNPATLFSLGALFLASLYFVMTRMLAGVESNATSQIWSSGIATLAIAPMAVPLWVWPESPLTALILTLIGVFGAVGHIAATYAHRMADASVLAPVIYVQILLVAFASWLVFATLPTLWTLGGGVIIIGSGLYIWWRERTKSASGETRLDAPDAPPFWRRFVR
ncbi:MAG: DMT family transporter [Pseudomonadota bacterium]